MSKNTKIRIGKTEWKNPVTTGSGTFGSGLAMTGYVDLNRLGAITIKGTTLEPRPGNLPPRMVETRSAVLGSVGLENPGVEAVLKDIIPKVALYDSVLVVNIGGSSVEDYGEVAARLNTSPDVDAIEINISCPNLKKGGLGFGTDPEMAGLVVNAVRRNTDKTVIAKLTPAVTDITVMAKAARDNGADALTLCNGYPGLAISTKTRKPILGNIQGGICGPSLKPLNMLHVWKTSQAVDIPIIALGGIMNAEDAIEYILAGATGVSIGTGNLVDPAITMKVADGIEQYLEESEFDDINELIGLAWKK
ncbi:MAG: dihydroorotate dehydrogenase [Hungatella sp.]|jgi:dihydroorotate dehydrogenase (NAD+) catalytic subunit|nr:dihydroorotate dehydrogenase [Hungatella sp.]